MAETLVEIHVPLVATSGLSDGDYQFPWIEDIEDFLIDLEDRGEVEVFDDGEEYEEVYNFFISGADEPALLAVAPESRSSTGFHLGPSPSSRMMKRTSMARGGEWSLRRPDGNAGYLSALMGD